jgi:Domain of unknown function (DUF4349)
MRTTLSAAQRRRLALVVPAGLTLIAMAGLAGCSGSSASSSSFASGTGEVANGAPAPADSAVPSAAASASAASGIGGGSAQDASANRVAPSGQQLIYTAQLTVRASDVSAAVAQATSIVTSTGGYVSAENATNDPNHPDRGTATISLKIPVAVYAATLARLSSGLGKQLSLQQQAQDVTQQVADVNSRVASDEAAIVQLRALLKHAGSVGDLLSVQDQINNEEGDLEAMQSQQSALNHETAFATVTITVLGPKAVPKPKKSKPAPGFSNGITGGWHAFRASVSWFLAIVGAVAPFAAVVAVLGGVVYWIRRRQGHRGQPGSSSE